MMANDADRRAVLRVALAAVVAADLLSFYFFVGSARTNAVAEGMTLPPFVEVLSRTTARGAAVLIGMVAAVAFGRRPGRLWPGGIALAALMLLSTVHTQLFGSPWRHLFFSGVSLTGWLLGLTVSRPLKNGTHPSTGLRVSGKSPFEIDPPTAQAEPVEASGRVFQRAVSRWHRTPEDESYAYTGCVALIGAAYLSSGISKLVFGGLEWLHGASIQAIVIVQDGMVSGGLLGGYRSWIVGAPAVSAAFAVATVAFELAGPLLLAGRWVRRGVALPPRPGLSKASTRSWRAGSGAFLVREWRAPGPSAPNAIVVPRISARTARPPTRPPEASGVREASARPPQGSTLRRAPEDGSGVRSRRREARPPTRSSRFRQEAKRPHYPRAAQRELKA